MRGTLHWWKEIFWGHPLGEGLPTLPTTLQGSSWIFLPSLPSSPLPPPPRLCRADSRAWAVVTWVPKGHPSPEPSLGYWRSWLGGKGLRFCPHCHTSLFLRYFLCFREGLSPSLWILPSLVVKKAHCSFSKHLCLFVPSGFPSSITAKWCVPKPALICVRALCNVLNMHRAVEMMLHNLSLGSHRAIWRDHAGGLRDTHPPNKE